MADAFLHALGKERVLVEVDRAIATKLLEFVRRFKLRSKVSLTDVSDEWNVFHLWGSDVESAAAARSDAIVRRDPRTPRMGSRVLLPSSAPKAVYENAHKATASDYLIHRILNGVPEGSREIVLGSSLPLECCMDYMNGIDFHKGCYIGQELTARTFFTGLVRKRIMPITLTPDGITSNQLCVDTNASMQLPAPETDIRLVSPEGGEQEHRPTRTRSAGKFITGIHNIGLAMLRFEHVNKAKGDTINTPRLAVDTESGQLQVTAWTPSWWPHDPVSTDESG